MSLSPLVLQGLCFGFTEKPLFRDLSLTLGEENPTVILGPSGCGKTTLLRLMAGLLPAPPAPPLLGPPGAAAFVFQEPRLLPWYRVLENVTLPLNRTLGKKEAESRARHFLSLVSLDDKLRAYPGELSGGQQQRVSMARAFAYGAPLILLDEPFQSLDIPLRLELMDLLLELLRRRQRRAVMVTHDPREALYLGERVLVLAQPPGGIILDETVSLPRKDRTYGSPALAGLEGALLKALASNR
ncbi:MAG: ATP-binding cassette domain-containing protein [Spirochaetaceae bacterium]|jgi:NitT/TauT family transport system ATP-binding protein|nr:ATP-binding cassette domain-containing protein [Spirochaetaceae bacterium]